MIDKNFVSLMKILDDANLSEDSKEIFKQLGCLVMRFYLAGQKDCIDSLRKDKE